MPDFVISHQKPQCFYSEYERKGENPHGTHYCPGCGHGTTHKLLAEAIDELGIRDRVILISPVGCSVFAYYYFDVGNIQVAHGRASAVACAVKRSHPDAIVISYQGDGDLAAIGCAEIVHAANRGDNISVLFVQNVIYGMTGGQMAPTTLVGQKTTTTPMGRNALNDGYPMKMSEMLSALDAPAYIERVGLGGVKQILQAKKAIRRALENQMKGLGFSLVEVLSPCPTIWKMDPVDAQKHVRETLTKVYPLGIKKDDPKPRDLERRAVLPALTEIPSILRLPTAVAPAALGTLAHEIDYRIKIAGFGGQGVLLLGQLLAEAGMDAGLDVSWLPSYGPEMRSGTSNCHVRLSRHPVDSPYITRPNVLMAMNEPSLRKFVHTVEPGGLVLYNGDAIPEDCVVEGLRMIARPFSAVADRLGSPKVANIVLLGAFLAETHALPMEFIDGALRRVVKSDRWLELDRKALAEFEEEYSHA